MPGERTPEQGNGDSTPVYGSFEEESFELDEEERLWDQQQSQVKEEKVVEGELMSTEECPQEPVPDPKKRFDDETLASYLNQFLDRAPSADKPLY